jgi:hypothetical protein
MRNVNWGRFILGALIVAAICFVSDGFLHNSLVHGQWLALYEALGIEPPGHAGWSMVYFVIFELGRGFLTMYVYVLLRPRLGPGATTATWAGVVAWVAYSLTGPVQFIPLGFFNEALWASAAAYQLVASIIAAIAGAAPYREDAAAGAARH